MADTADFRLLLTSGGISNEKLAQRLFDLGGKSPADTSLSVVPTASHIGPGDRSWLIDDLYRLKALGFKRIDIVDIAAIGKKQWLPRLEAADILYFSGGNRYFLMECLNRSGLTLLLPRLLETRVFVGTSGGSMVTGKTLGLKLSHTVLGDDRRTQDMEGLGYVDFHVVPHLGNPHFPRLEPKLVEAALTGFPEKVYALDDHSAVQVVGGRVEVVGGGNWSLYQNRLG